MNLSDKTPNFREPQGDHYRLVVYGKGSELALSMFQELRQGGYALTQRQVETATLTCIKEYAGWAVLEAQRTANGIQELSLDITLMGDEASTIKAYLHAYCDVMQARLSDASKAMGVSGYAIDLQSANSNLEVAREKMKLEAYCEPPIVLNRAKPTRNF